MLSLFFIMKALWKTKIHKAHEKDLIGKESKIRPLTLRIKMGFHGSN